MIGPDSHVHPDKRPGTGITLSQYGRFEGFVFVFRYPVRTRDGKMIKRLDLAGAMLDHDWSPHEVIAALLNPLPDHVLQTIEANDVTHSPFAHSDYFAYPPDSVPVVAT